MYRAVTKNCIRVEKVIETGIQKADVTRRRRGKTGGRKINPKDTRLFTAGGLKNIFHALIRDLACFPTRPLLRCAPSQTLTELKIKVEILFPGFLQIGDTLTLDSIKTQKCSYFRFSREAIFKMHTIADTDRTHDLRWLLFPRFLLNGDTLTLDSMSAKTIG